MTEQSPSPYCEMAAAALTSDLASVSLEILLWLAKSSKEKVRTLAAAALCMSDADDALAALFEVYSSGSTEVRSTIVYSLSFSPNPKAQPLLLEIVNSGASASLRTEAIAALARRGEPLAYETVLGWADSQQKFHRQAAAQWLAAGREWPDALERLLILAKDDETEVRANAAVSLGEFDDARAFSVLLNMQGSRFWQDQLGATLGLQVMGQRAADLLIDRISNTTDERELISLIETLSRMDRSSKTRRAILDYALVDAKIWISVANEVADVGDKLVKTSIVSALSSSDVRIRQTAAKVLGVIGDEETITPLVNLLCDSSWEVRINAAQSLEQTSLPAPGLLHEALRAPHPSVRTGVADILGRMRFSESSEVLMDALLDPNRLVRANAAGALGMIGDIRSVPPLIQALIDTDKGVRNMAAGALRKIGASEGLAAVRAWTLERRASAVQKS